MFPTRGVPRNKPLKTKKPEEGRVRMQIELDLNPNAFGLDSQSNTKEYLGKWYHDVFHGPM